MKKIIATLIMAAGVYTYSQAQGTVAVYNIGGANGNSTNTTLSPYVTGGTQGSVASGLAGTAANGFYYALLYATYGGAAPAGNPTSSSWNLGMMATNYLTAGGIRGTGGSTGAGIAGWAGGTTNYIELVGWSANLGTTWAQVSAQVNNNWSTTGYFGVSSVGFIAAASSPSPATSIFGGTGLPGGITMFQVQPVVVPEPTTLALAGLSGASLLLFRRRK